MMVKCDKCGKKYPEEVGQLTLTEEKKWRCKICFQKYEKRKKEN